MATAVKEKKEAKKKAKPEKPEKSEKFDKESGGFREGTATWAVYQVLREACDKDFTREELTKKSIIFCREQKIKIDADSRVPILLGWFKKQGWITKVGKDEYKKLIR